MTTRRSRRRGPGRPPIHDPEQIRSLLAEREYTGESFAELAARSGIPAGTLSSRSRQAAMALRVQAGKRRSAFVEVVVADEPADAKRVNDSFEIVVGPTDSPRRVLVPAGFDASELQRLVAALEDRC